MISTLINPHCELGENPLWNPADGSLCWTDITGGALHHIQPSSGEHRIIYRGEPVGGVTLQSNGSLLLFRVNDIALLSPGGRVEVMRGFADEGAARFNDVIADPEGRVFAGTIGRTDTSGGLYRFERDGAMTLLFRGTGVSNGMGFSPDLRTFYWTCSTRRRIFAFDYDRASGALTAERVFYQASDDEGIPDGLTVDREGNIWSARWDGYAVVQHAPDGRVMRKFLFPVAKVSSLCFGGPSLDEIFVTTAGGQPGSDTADGSLYHWCADLKGVPEFHSRILIRTV
ncbi:MAG: SMP-30/gluconolactonase/LRE family protein [Verrucomicrobiales bacterium]